MECSAAEAHKTGSMNSKESDKIQGGRIDWRPTQLSFVGYFKELVYSKSGQQGF